MKFMLIVSQFLIVACLATSCRRPPPVLLQPVTQEADGITFVLIKAGSFLMGSPEGELHSKEDERPQTEVTITRDYYMGQSPVTVGQFTAFVRATGYETVSEREGWSHFYTADGIEERPRMSWHDPGFAQDPTHPVVNVGWEDIQAFCAYMSNKTGKIVRLPTEAEWEYACRAGTTTAYWWADLVDEGIGKANLYDTTGERYLRQSTPADVAFTDGYAYTSPVATFEPNPWGLYDMHGNVWEWCSDIYPGPHPGGELIDPTGATEGEYHIRRGGSYFPGPGTARSANRGRSRADFRVNNRGFRVLMEVDEEE